MTTARLHPEARTTPSQALIDAVVLLVKAAEAQTAGTADYRTAAIAGQAAQQFIAELAELRTRGVDLHLRLAPPGVDAPCIELDANVLQATRSLPTSAPMGQVGPQKGPA